MITRRSLIASTLILPLSCLALPGLANSRRSSAIVTGQALSRINAYRKRRDRDPLVIDPRAEKAALAHSEEMALLGELRHDNFKSRLAAAEIVAPSAENIAVGHRSIAAVLNSWEKSRGHRSNLLGAYNRAGMAVARNANSGNIPYWTLIMSV